MKKFICVFIALAYVSILSGQPDQPWQQKISPALLEKTSDGRQTAFLILLSEQANLTEARNLNTKTEKGNYIFESLQKFANHHQANLVSFLKKEDITHQPLFIVNAIKAEGTLEQIYSIAQRNDVKQILDDEDVHYPDPVSWSPVVNNSRLLIEWNIERINADDVWAMGIRGQGVVVAGEDTGYEWTHASLKKQYRGYNEVADTADHNYNWHDAIHTINPLNSDTINPCGLSSKVPCDDRGHGTHTMGTMIGLDSIYEIGVAPGAKWCGCRNMERGWGSPFTYIECFQWFLAPTDLNDENPDPSKAPHVINNSWGCPVLEGCDSSNWTLMNQVVDILRLAGIVVVVSAGNSGSSCESVSVPAAMFEGSFTVGATSFNDTIAGFSSRGPVGIDSSYRLKPNVSAPGVGILSASLGGGYNTSSGTSMAGPHVAGLVALIISANPNLAGQVDIIENIIEQTAVPKTTDQNCGEIPGSQVPNNTYGYGRIDALAAVEAALALIPVNTEQDDPSMEVRIYPNPVSDHLIIETSQLTGNLFIEIYDLQGRLILQQHHGVDQSFITINMHDQPSGIYFFRILNDGNLQQGRIAKQ